MKKMMFAAAIAQEKRNDMSTQGMNTLARERDYQAISERLSRMVTHFDDLRGVYRFEGVCG